jgi:hypothetical protein
MLSCAAGINNKIRQDAGYVKQPVMAMAMEASAHQIRTIRIPN